MEGIWLLMTKSKAPLATKTFSVSIEFTASTGKKWTAERHAIGHTHARASNEQASDPITRELQNSGQT
jgi:pantothenate kinase